MTATAKPSSLVSALARIQATLPIVHKGETAKVPTKTGGSYSYSYADLSDVARVVYPILGEVGLAFIAMPTFKEDGKYVLVGELAHESGDSRKGEFALPDRGTAQEVGSAISYGRRYLLGCLTGIVTGDQDDDGEAASKAPQRATQPRQQTPQPKDYENPAPLQARIDASTTPAELAKVGEEIGATYLEDTDADLLRQNYRDRMAELKGALPLDGAA